MSVALLIDYPQATPADPGRYVPVSGEERYWRDWDPIILKEGYRWLPGMGVGIDFDAENLPEVLSELQQLQVAVPRYYEPGSDQYQRMMERLVVVIEELQAVDPARLTSGEIKLFIG